MISTWRLAAYFLRLGAIGFGGPIALVGYMQRDLVERRGWMREDDFTEGVAFSQLAPGPLAAQLAMYLGWVRGGAWGATLCGVAFILPSFAIVLALSAVYMRYGGIAWMQSAFYGVGAAVIAVIARSALKLVRLTVRADRLLWAVFLVNAVVVAVTQREIIWVIVASGAVVLLPRASLRARATAAALALFPAAGMWTTAPAAQLFWFFAKAGAVVFGSGLAIVPYLYGGVVQQHHWLSERQFLDAVAVSLITPGPVVITVAFIGYLVAGVQGGTLAALGTFLPVYLSVVLLAPPFKRYSGNARVKAFVSGVTAAATGALAGAVIVLGRRAITDRVTVAIALVALIVVARWKRVPDAALIVASGVAGVLLA